MSHLQKYYQLKSIYWYVLVQNRNVDAAITIDTKLHAIACDRDLSVIIDTYIHQVGTMAVNPFLVVKTTDLVIPGTPVTIESLDQMVSCNSQVWQDIMFFVKEDRFPDRAKGRDLQAYKRFLDHGNRSL